MDGGATDDGSTTQRCCQITAVAVRTGAKVQQTRDAECEAEVRLRCTAAVPQRRELSAASEERRFNDVAQAVELCRMRASCSLHHAMNSGDATSSL